MPITIKQLGLTDYEDTLQDMKYFVDQISTKDELWIIAEKTRNKDIWKKNLQNEWVLEFK